MYFDILLFLQANFPNEEFLHNKNYGISQNLCLFHANFSTWSLIYYFSHCVIILTNITYVSFSIVQIFIYCRCFILTFNKMNLHGHTVIKVWMRTQETISLSYACYFLGWYLTSHYSASNWNHVMLIFLIISCTRFCSGAFFV